MRSSKTDSFLFYVGTLTGALFSAEEDPEFIAWLDSIGYQKGNLENLKVELNRVARCLYDRDEGKSK